MRQVLNDVTTDFVQPPAFIEMPKRLPRRNFTYPSHFVEIQKKLHPEIAPLHVPMAPNRVWACVEKVAREEFEVVAADGLRLEAVAVTRLLRFRDDVVIELRPEGAGCEVHMRSKSRLGRSDLGANARRIRHVFERILACLSDL